MNTETKISDAEYTANWDAMLKVFHGIEPSDKDAIAKYEALQDEAKNTIALTPRQREGIHDRCEWQIKLIKNPEFAKKVKEKSDFHMAQGNSGVTK